MFTKPGAARAGLMYYREVFSPRGRAASAVRREKKLDMPILTLGGGYADRDTLLQTMRQFAGNLRGHIFEGVGHHLPEECPEDMADVIFDFWREER